MKQLIVLFGAVALTLAETSITTFETPVKGFAYSSVAPTPYIRPYITPYAYPYSYPYPLVPGTQYHTQDILGRATYGHSDPFQVETAVQDALGNKVGGYSYISPEGKVINTRYVADAAGFRVASNALPVAPSIPVVPEVMPPSPVMDTPEVMAAREAHLAEVEAVKSRSRRDVSETPASTTKVIPDPRIISYPGVLPYASLLPYDSRLSYKYPTDILPTILPTPYLSPFYPYTYKI